MRKIYFVLALIVLPFLALAQNPKSIIVSGNWTDITPWADNIPASAVIDDVTMSSSTAITVQSVDNIQAGFLDAGNNNTLTIDPGGQLQLGDATHTKDVTAGTSMAIVANDGVLTIWGNLVVNNSLAITIQGPSGAIIIKGDIIMANGASLIVNGSLTVGGNFTGGTGTNVTVGAGGSIGVNGTLTVGAGSHVNLNCVTYSPDTGCGTFHAHSCAPDPSSQAFCSTAGLPVELLFFKAEARATSVQFNWATASELNFDYFIVEKSSDGKTFSEIGSIQGQKTTKEQHDYTLEDKSPLLGINYYRLLEVDLDHTATNLKVVVVEFTGAKMLNFYPNPVTNGEVTFKLNFVPDGEVAVSILDLRGVILTEFVLNKPDVTLPVQLGSGTYVVMARSSNFRSVGRMLVK